MLEERHRHHAVRPTLGQELHFQGSMSGTDWAKRGEETAAGWHFSNVYHDDRHCAKCFIYIITLSFLNSHQPITLMRQHLGWGYELAKDQVVRIRLRTSLCTSEDPGIAFREGLLVPITDCHRQQLCHPCCEELKVLRKLETLLQSNCAPHSASLNFTPRSILVIDPAQEMCVSRSSHS